MSNRENIAVIHVAKYLDGYDRLCNHNCIFCMERMEPGASSEKLPSLFEIESAILQYKKKHGEITKLYIAGGEPTLRRDFSDIMKLAYNYCDNLVLSTSCDYKDINNIVNLIGKLGIKNVATSIHGSTSQLHDKLTGIDGSLCNTLTTIRELLSRGINVTINSVICAFNIQDMPQIAQMFLKNGISISKLTFTHYIHHGNAYYNDELKFNVDKYKNVLSEVIDSCNCVPYEITFRDFPICIDERIFSHQEIIERINIISLKTDKMVAISEKAPVLVKEKCYKCRFFDSCPKYLMANYMED